MNDIFNQNIIKYLHLENLDEAKQEKTLLRIGKVIYQAMMLRIMEILTEEEQKEFEKVLDEVGTDENRQSEVIDFLKSKIPNLDEISKEEITKLKEETVSVMGNLE
ncbi:MAG: DUF5663 domain-containing protein [Patescibacteria group bacterium]|nr:DUF5663 domain-containing protein [Patescibacteria group bacterium]